MNLAEMRHALEHLRSQINALIEAPSVTDMDRADLQARLERVGELRDQWDALNAQYQREKGITSW